MKPFHILTTKYNFLANSKFLAFWLACGLSIQIGMVFWPIGNYATLVYLMFYLPLVILLLIDRKNLNSVILNSDRFTAISLIALLCWIQASSLQTVLESDTDRLFGQTLKFNILILLYIIGVAYLARQWPKVLFFSLISSIILAAALASISIYNMYFIIDHVFTRRISIYGMGDFAISANPVTAGIFFGSLSVFIIALLFNRLLKSSIFVLILLSLISLPCLTITFLTGTRSAMLSISIAALMCAFFNQKTKAGITISIIVVITLAYGLLAESTYLNDLFMRGGFGGWRPEIWRAAVQLGLENFWFGMGMWSDTNMLITNSGASQIIPHSHNHYLQLLIWTGLVGLTIYVLLLLSAIRMCIPNKNDPLIEMATFVLTYFAIIQFFDVYSIFTRPSYYWPCVWLPIGIILGRSQANETSR